MARKERGLFRMILRDFLKSLRPKIPKHTCVGQDYFGTKYYEIEKTESIHKKPNRYFVPTMKDNFEQELPAEWEAWLRHRRASPPTQAEVNANYELIIIKRENATKLEATYATNKVTDIGNPDEKPLTQHTSIGFPVYEEYRGITENYKRKK